MRLLTKCPGPQTNSHVEGGEELRPASLTTHKHLCRREVLRNLAARDHVDRMMRRLKIMLPCVESREDSEQILMVSVVVELGTR